jgi:GT2 family glycosyltransferase
MISLIIPTTSKNQNYTQNILTNIQSLYGDTVEIIIEENDSVTLGENYNNAVKRATGEKIILLHNDMIISPGFVERMDKDIQPNRITTYTRIEPPIYDDIYPGKVLLDCGTDIETFNEDKFLSYKSPRDIIDGGSQLFFGCMKTDYIGIDGHTFKMFCEDDDLHRRYRLLGFEHKVSPAHVYHFVSKTSRADNSYQQIEIASNRNFIRKWGSRSNAPKYNVGIQVTHCNSELLTALEPWCDRIYIDDEMQVLTTHYMDSEQPNTSFDLTKRVMTTTYNNPHEYDDVVVELDRHAFTQQDFAYIQQLAEIIQTSGEPGEFRLGNLKITIYRIESREKDLIVCE